MSSCQQATSRCPFSPRRPRALLMLPALAAFHEWHPLKSRKNSFRPRWVPGLTNFTKATLEEARPTASASCQPQIGSAFNWVQLGPRGRLEYSSPPACVPAASVASSQSNQLLALLHQPGPGHLRSEGGPPKRNVPTRTELRLIRLARDALKSPYERPLSPWNRQPTFWLVILPT
jgi:hypothetical protein